MLKRQIKERKDRETLPTASEGIVVLNEPAWRDNDAFDHLIRKHLVQYHRLGIEKLASSIVRHWIGKQGGRFVDNDPTGEVKTLTDEPGIAIKVGVLLRSVVRTSNATLLSHAQGIPPPIHSSQSQDATSSSLSSSDQSLLDHIHDKEPKAFGKNALLPLIPHDIFDQPMPELSPHNSPRRSQDRHPRVPLNTKSPERDAEIMESRQRSAVATVTSCRKAIRNSDEHDLMTPKIDNTTESKKQSIKPIHTLNETQKRQTPDPTLLPPKKRLKKSVSFDLAAKSPMNKFQPSASEMEPTRDHQCEIPSYTTNDVLFAGKWARDHKGNLLLNEWTARFCKRFNAQSNRNEIARQIVTLFKNLAGRFLEAKRSPLDGKTIWVDLEDNVAIERTSVLIGTMVINKKPGYPRTLDESPDDGTVDLKRLQNVKILKMDIKSYQICRGNDFIKLESKDNDQLWINDVMLGSQGGRETHYGNLKFFHHIDDYGPKYERATTIGGKLNVIRQIISTWKKNFAKDIRFVVRHGNVYSIVEADDELTVFLGVAEMIKEIIRPIPNGSHDIHLGDKWTIQRTHQRNREYYKLITSNLSAFGAVPTSASLIREELAIAGNVIRKACWKSYPTGPFKGDFKVFDTTAQDWVLVSLEEAVKRTLVLMRLKAHFSGISTKTDDSAALSKSELGQHIEARTSPHGLPSTNRPGATRPAPSPLRGALLATSKGGTNLASLLQSELWSPPESPEKGENCRPATPASAISSHSLVADASSTRSEGMTSLMHPVARHSKTQLGLVPEWNVRQLHNWAPVLCDPNIIPKSPHESSERLFHPLLHGRFMPQHPNSSAFWPPHPRDNLVMLNPPSLRHPVHENTTFIVPNPNHRLVWLPFPVHTDGGTPGST
jgi:hypothetical protein